MKDSLNRKNRRFALNLIMVIAGMLMLTYSMPTLYRIFCETTGFGGTPKIAKTLPAHNQQLSRAVNIKFDTNIDSALGWQFAAEEKMVISHIGENTLATFSAYNPNSVPQYGMASYNITPEKAAKYFNKVMCFCFSKQLIKPKQKIVFPVSFFIDPEFANDPFMSDVDTITLSYTFYQYNDKNNNSEQTQ